MESQFPNGAANGTAETKVKELAGLKGYAAPSDVLNDAFGVGGSEAKAAVEKEVENNLKALEAYTNKTISATDDKDKERLGLGTANLETLKESVGRIPAGDSPFKTDLQNERLNTTPAGETKTNPIGNTFGSHRADEQTSMEALDRYNSKKELAGTFGAKEAALQIARNAYDAGLRNDLTNDEISALARDKAKAESEYEAALKAKNELDASNKENALAKAGPCTAGWPACAIRENIVNPIRQFIGWAPIQETPGAGGVKTETAVAGAATTNTVPTTRETVSNSVNPADAFKGNEKLIADSDERLHAAVEGYTKDVPTVSDRDHDKAYVESWEARKAYINNLEKTLADPKTQEAGSAEIGRKLDAARADLKEFEGQFKKGAGSPGGAEELQAMKDSLGEQAAADKKSADDAEAARKRAEQEAADRSRVGGGNGGGGSGGGGANKSIADVLSGLMGGGQNSAECEAAKSQCSANRSTAACQKVAQCQSQSSNPLSQLGQMLGKALGGGGSSGSAAQPGSVAANAACNAYPGTTLTNGQCACQQSGYSFYQAGTTLNGAPVPTSGCYAPSVAAGTNPGGQTPVATISCATNAADVGMTIPVSWSCQNSVTARVDGFTPAAQELAQLSGSSQVTVAKPASGSSVDYTVTCINQGQTDVKKCTVAIGQPGLAIVAIPDRPEVGKTSIIGWYSTGMSSCSIKGGRMKGGTGSPIDEFTKEGTSGSITLPPIEDGDVFEAGLACVSTSGQTTTKGIEIRQKQ
jgi:hypothetical protein